MRRQGWEGRLRGCTAAIVTRGSKDARTCKRKHGPCKHTQKHERRHTRDAALMVANSTKAKAKAKRALFEENRTPDPGIPHAYNRVVQNYRSTAGFADGTSKYPLQSHALPIELQRAENMDGTMTLASMRRRTSLTLGAAQCGSSYRTGAGRRVEGPPSYRTAPSAVAGGPSTRYARFFARRAWPVTLSLLYKMRLPKCHIEKARLSQ